MIRYLLRKFQMKTEDFPTYRMYLATVYAFMAANIFVYGFWSLIKDKIPDTPEKKELYKQKMKNDGIDVTFVTIDGLSVTYDYSDDTKSRPKEDIEDNVI